MGQGGFSPEVEIEARCGLWPAPSEGDLRFEVRAVAQRRVFGRTDVLIRPAAGEGERWVAETNVEWIDE